MNTNPNGNNNGYDGIDLIDLSAGREMDAIRRNEMIAKERRRKRAAEIRRREMLRQKKIAAIKRAIFAWCTLIFAIIIIVAAIIGITSAVKDGEDTPDTVVGNKVAQEELDMVSSFVNAEKSIVGDTETAKTLSAMLDDTATLLDTQNPVKHMSELFLAVDAYGWNASLDNAQTVRNYVRDMPIFSNGYVFSSKQSMKSPVTDSYLYDTNSSFIIAVSEICRYDGSTAFLSQMDNTSDHSKDVSKGMTVGEKLFLAADYLFDTQDLNGGGIRFNMDDNLVYILTEDNDGTGNGKPSNIFFNHRFGYLDAYNNILFNKAMQSLSYLCKMKDDTEKSEMYLSVAENNKKAINDTFYNETLGRYSACIDAEGKMHDGGMTAVNLAAVAYGISDSAKTKKILSWIDGKTKISTDSLDSAQIMKTPSLPVFSTVKALDSWWYDADGKYPLTSDADFGNYWMNGTKSVLCGYFDVLARSSADEKTVITKLDDFVSSYANGKIKPDSDKTSLSEPDLYFALAMSNAVKKSLGISADEKTLVVDPASSFEKPFGIKDISFNSNRYGVLFDETGTYVTSYANAAVKLSIGGFAPGSSVTVTVVEDEGVLSEETAKADKNGCVFVVKRFGDNSYVKLCEVAVKKK